MLVATSTPSAIQATIGQPGQVTCRFTSDENLIGQTIYLDSALWKTGSPSTTPPQTNYFSAVFPVLGGHTVLMTWTGDLRYRNLYARIKSIDANTFNITLQYLNRADLPDFTSEAGAINPSDSFQSQSFYGSSVYNNDSELTLAVSTSGGDSATCEIPYSATYFDSCGIGMFYTLSAPSPVQGWLAGEDLRIQVYLEPITTESVASQFIAGIFRTDTVDGSVDFTMDHELSLATIDNGATNYSPQSSVDRISTGIGFVNVGGIMAGEFTVNGNYFTSGGQYYFYIVYNIDGQWCSAISQLLAEDESSAGFDPTYGSTTCTITVDGTAHSSCCVTGVAPGATVQVCNVMNTTEYDAAVFTNNTTGDYASNLVSISAVLADNVPPQGQNPTGTAYAVDSSGCVDLTATWTGTKYLIFTYVFDMGNYTDTIHVPTTITVDGTASDISTPGNISLVSIQDEALADVNAICVGSTGLVTACFSNSLGTDYTFIAALVTEDGDAAPNGALVSSDTDFTGPGGLACVVVDTDLLEEGVIYCFDIESEALVPDEPINCQLACFDLSIQQAVTAVNDNQVELTFDYNSPEPLQEVVIVTSTGETYTSALDIDSFTFNVDNEALITVTYTIVVTTDTGCVYETVPTLIVCNALGESAAETYDICSSPPDPDTLGCGCDNTATIIPSCDDSTNPVTIDATWDSSGIVSTIDVETKEYSLDNSAWLPYTTAITGTAGQTLIVWFRWTISFTDSCDDIVVFGYQTCTPEVILECDNTPNLELTYDDVAETLTPTNTGTYSSTVLDPGIEYSIDLGVTWTPYTTPVSTAALASGAVVMFSIFPVYDDGCPSEQVIVQWVKDDEVVNCDYSGFILTCEYDSDTDQFTGTYTGDTANLVEDAQEFSDNGGASWQTYGGAPIATSSMFVVFRWTLKFDGCDRVTLICAAYKPCPDPCDDIVVTMPEGPISVTIDGCVPVTDCPCPPGDEFEAGTGDDIEVCD